MGSRSARRAGRRHVRDARVGQSLATGAHRDRGARGSAYPDGQTRSVPANEKQRVGVFLSLRPYCNPANGLPRPVLVVRALKVALVHLVYLVLLVGLVQPNKRDKPNK